MVTEESVVLTLVDIAELRERFDEVFTRLRNGETVAIVSEGRTLKNLSPESGESLRHLEASTAWVDFLEDKATWPPAKVTREEILAWRHEGHRW